MPPHALVRACAIACLLAPVALPTTRAADDTVATAVSARVGNGYKRVKLKDGSFKPEYYALSNGGRIFGSTGDITVDRVTYPEVAEITMRLLASQNYHYAKSAGQAKLLLTLYWGNTIAFNRPTYDQSVNSASNALETLKWMAKEGTTPPSGSLSAIGSEAGNNFEAAAFESAMMQLLMNNRVRDRLNATNSELLGYSNDLNRADGPQRWAGGGDHFNDLLADVEESRYYIVILAYDFEELTKRQNKKLLWTTRVSVRTPGNRFDDSYLAMLKSASKYFGQDSGKVVRGEETKGTVEMKDLKFLGEAKETAPAKAESSGTKPK
jgi:hypothetical protein